MEQYRGFVKGIRVTYGFAYKNSKSLQHSLFFAAIAYKTPSESMASISSSRDPRPSPRNGLGKEGDKLKEDKTEERKIKRAGCSSSLLSPRLKLSGGAGFSSAFSSTGPGQSTRCTGERKACERAIVCTCTRARPLSVANLE